MTVPVVIIGGGPAGLMASLAAAQSGANVILLDKGDRLGRKLAISGGGRCNVTNAKQLDELIRHIPGNGRFLYSALTSFGNHHIIDFFENLGIQLKEEDRGRMFPVSDKAKTVVDALLQEIRRLGVDIRTHCPVKHVLLNEHSVKGVLLENGHVLKAAAVIVATGGKSVPHTGSTGDGYPWARAAGHTITDLFPTEVPITSKETWILNRSVQGVSLRNIELTVHTPENKAVKTHEGDLIFTHFGISGPVVLRCSQYVVQTQKKFSCKELPLTIDLMPDLSQSEILQQLRKLAASEPKKAIKNVLKIQFPAVIPDRLLPQIFATADVRSETTYPQLSNHHWQSLVTAIKQFPLTASGTLSIEEAFITGGGVSVKEIDPKTMASKFCDGLYFCGEILDIHGYTGGFNITAAFSTGHCAGRSAAEYVNLHQELV